MTHTYRALTPSQLEHNPGPWILVGIFTFVGMLNLVAALAAGVLAGGTLGPFNEEAARMIGNFYGAGPFLAGLPDSTVAGALTTLGVAFLVLSIANFVVAWGIADYRRWAWSAGIGLAVIGLVVFPVGTILAVVTLVYLGMSRAAFDAPHYREERVERRRSRTT